MLKTHYTAPQKKKKKIELLTRPCQSYVFWVAEFESEIYFIPTP